MANGDFWKGLGNMVGDYTGYNQAQTAKTQNVTGAANQAAGAGTMGAAATGAAGIAGKSATDFAKESGAAGQALGQQMGTEAATQGTQQATQAARTGGLNKGQAAMMGAQQAGNAYTQGMQGGRAQGAAAYGAGANTQLGGVNTQGNVGAQQGQLGSSQVTAAQGSTTQGTKQSGGIVEGIGKVLALSDDRQKESISEGPSLEEILRKIMPSKFDYKPETGETPGAHIGIMAQDIEKTPMKENVIDTPRGKMVHGPKQENSNLNLIVQLAARIKELEAQIGDDHGEN